MGHFWRANLGHFSRVPKVCDHLKLLHLWHLPSQIGFVRENATFPQLASFGNAGGTCLLACRPTPRSPIRLAAASPIPPKLASFAPPQAIASLALTFSNRVRSGNRRFPQIGFVPQNYPPAVQEGLARHDLPISPAIPNFPSPSRPRYTDTRNNSGINALASDGRPSRLTVTFRPQVRPIP